MKVVDMMVEEVALQELREERASCRELYKLAQEGMVPADRRLLAQAKKQKFLQLPDARKSYLAVRQAYEYWSLLWGYPCIVIRPIGKGFVSVSLNSGPECSALDTYSASIVLQGSPRYRGELAVDWPRHPALRRYLSRYSWCSAGSSYFKFERVPKETAKEIAQTMLRILDFQRPLRLVS